MKKLHEKKLSAEDKTRLGVLWVLLNSTTETNYSTSAIVDLMNAIEEFDPSAPKMWRKNFKILVDDKVAYEWKAQ